MEDDEGFEDQGLLGKMGFKSQTSLVKPWSELLDRIDKFWIPGEAPHQSIIAQTRGGKSHLVRHGIIEPLCQYDKVLVIDVKGDDPTLEGFGHPVRNVPQWNWRFWNDEPDSKWFRLIVEEDWDRARTQVATALAQVRKQGGWVIYLDETRALTDPRPPGIRLQPEVEQIWLRGGSRRNCLLAGTQAPKWVPNSFYTQPQFFWVGRVEDEDSQKRLREIGSLNRSILPTIANLKKHHFLEVDNQEDERHVAISKVEYEGE
jgi:hypothetical protein